MTSNYREQDQFLTSEEESRSSSSSEESQGILGVLSSPTSEYLIQSFLGEGVYGKVAKCTKAATREQVAVKIMKDSKLTEEVKNELAMLQYLRDFDSDRYNFARWNGGFIDGENICLEFEVLDVSLMDFVEKKPSHCLSVKEIRPILHQMATTLQLLRSLGVVHTDLKPDNIMLVDHLNQPFKVKMIDFGLARHVSQSQWGSYVQPLYYRSPEVILGFPFTAAIDMWSLGCVAAELYLGYVLYPASCEYDMIRHMVKTQGLLPQQVLNDGLKTKQFFQRNRCRRWRLKTPGEYGERCNETYFDSLDELKEVRPACHLSDEDTKAEMEDRNNFIELLKKMLHLDVNERVTPSQLLEDPFITMNDLADSYSNSLYLKSCCERMEVCQDQSLSSDNRDQQSWLNPQPSTSMAGLDQHFSHQVPPAWHSHQEHPLILGIASAVSSCLSIHENLGPSQPQQLSFSFLKERPQPALQLPVTSHEAQSYTGRVQPVRKRSRDTFESSLSRKRRPEGALPESKRLAMDLAFFKTRAGRLDDSGTGQLLQNSEENSTSMAKAKPLRRMTRAAFTEQKRRERRMRSLLHASREAPSECAAEIKPGRKRTRATFTAAHSRSRSPFSTSPERRRMSPDSVQTPKEIPIQVCQSSPKPEFSQNSKDAPTEAPSCEAKVRPQRKRTWATFIASHLGLRRPPESGSPERKRMKMGLLHESREALTEAISCEAKVRLQRKRTWATFIASHLGLRRPPESRSPERKKMKMGLLHESRQALIGAPSGEAKVRPQRKRTLDTLIASHLGQRRPPESGSPERKKMKMGMDEVETQTKVLPNSNQASSSKAETSESDNKNPECSSPKTRTRRKRRREGSDGQQAHKKPAR